MDLITYFKEQIDATISVFKELISLAMDSIPFIVVICYFVFGLIVFNHRATNKVLLRWRIPRKMIIPLRTLLSTILFVLSFNFIFDEDISTLFKFPFAIGYMIITPLCPIFILLLIRFISSKAQKNWNNWWQNIVYASVFTSLIWQWARKEDLIGIVTLWGALTLLLTATIWHFITLNIYAKHRKHFERIRYCLLSYLVLACLFFSLGGYRNTERNYTIEESKEAEAFLWEYDVCRMSKHIPCLVFFTPAIGISCMYIGCGVAILLLSLVRHINIGTEEDWWKGYEIYLIGGFIFSLYFSIRTIISVWKKVLHHK